MKHTLIKAAAILCLVAATSSCYGPFRLTNKLHSWNGQVSQKKFVNELVFLGLCILPAYEICVLGDGLIFNSIEFWGGNNPIAMKDGLTEETQLVHKGQTYKVIKSRNNMTVALEDGSQKVDFRYFPEETAWYQMNGDTKVKVVDIKGKKVFSYLPNSKTLVFDHNNMDMIEAETAKALAME